MEPRFQLFCLGEPMLIGPDGQPIRFKVRKHLALLVYLAVESKARHRREHLAELLWPNLSEADGRHSLATALTMLRARFGRDVVEAGREDLRWAHSRLELDLDRLAAGNVLGDDFTSPLNVAGFLDGFEVPGAGEFMLWRERQRARWLPLVRDALVVLMDRCRRTADSRQIEQLADRMLVLDDLSEEAIRGKMEARAFAGDRLGALKIFEAWKERLDEELGASPSALLEGMALRLRRRGWERSGASDIPSVRTDQWKNRPFVGRAIEYRMLYEGWERAQQGGAGHALVLGESGIGKSTLVERLTTAAGLEGASVTRVQCYELEREIPYAAVCGLVRGLLDRPGASATSSEALAELARSVPDVRRRFPGIPQASDSEGETARIRLAEAMQELVFAISEEHPVVIVVDDHHLADDASLAVLHLLMRRAQDRPVMVILIARQSEMGRSPQAARLQESLPRLGAANVELHALNDADCQVLLSSFIPSDGPQPNGAARRALVHAARGFPMILELLSQDWLLNGEQSLALSLDAMTPDPSQVGSPAEAYRQLHDRIIETLDPVSRNVLNLATILGHRLNDISMYAIADLTVGQTMQGMSYLTATRVLRDSGDGLEFINELIRAHAYLQVPSAMRRVLHGAIADRLIESDEQGVEVQGLEVAWHCIRSGRSGEASPYLLRGARQAIQQGAPQQAERGLSSGLSILQGPDRDLGRLLLAEAYQEQDMWMESLAILESLDPAFATHHHDQVYPLRVYAQHHAGMIGPDNVQDAIFELERIARTSESVERSVTAFRIAARVAYLEKLREPTHRLVALTKRLKAESMPPEVRLSLHYAAAILYAHVGDRHQSEDELCQAAQIVQDRSISNALAQAIEIGLGALMCADGKYEAALEHLTIGRRMGDRLGADDSIALCEANSALCWGRLGRYDRQIDCAQRAAAILGARFLGYRNIQVATAMGYGHAMTDNRDGAMRAIEWVDQAMPNVTPAWQQQGWHFAKADVLALLGKRVASHTEALKGLTGPHAVLHAPMYAGSFARWLAVAGSNGKVANGSVSLDTLLQEIHLFDAIDQVEIAAACLLWNSQAKQAMVGTGLKKHIDEVQLSIMAARLPPPAMLQLKLLGLPVRGT